MLLSPGLFTCQATAAGIVSTPQVLVQSWRQGVSSQAHPGGARRRWVALFSWVALLSYTQRSTGGQLKGVHAMERFFCSHRKDVTVSSKSFWPSNRCFMFGSWLCHLLPVWPWACHLLFPSVCSLSRPKEGEDVGRAGTSSGMTNTWTAWW